MMSKSILMWVVALLIQNHAFANDTFLGRGIFNPAKAEAIYLVCKNQTEHNGCDKFLFYKCNFGLTSFKELHGNIENICSPELMKEEMTSAQVESIKGNLDDWKSENIDRRLQTVETELKDPLKISKEVWTKDGYYIAPSIDAAAGAVAIGYSLELAAYKAGPVDPGNPMNHTNTAGQTAENPGFNNVPSGPYYSSMSLVQWAQYCDAVFINNKSVTTIPEWNYYLVSDLLNGSNIRTLQQAAQFFYAHPDVITREANSNLNQEWNQYLKQESKYQSYLNKSLVWNGRIPSAKKNTEIAWGATLGTGAVPLLADGGRKLYNLAHKSLLNKAAARQKHKMLIAWTAVRYEGPRNGVVTFEGLLSVDDEIFSAISNAINQ